MKKLLHLALMATTLLLSTTGKAQSGNWGAYYTGNYNLYQHRVIPSSEGGFIFVGKESGPTGFNIIMHKKQANGGPEWMQEFGGSGEDIANSVMQDDNGDYIIVGSTTSTDGSFGNNYGGRDVFVIKTDMYGTIIWTQTFGGDGEDIGIDIVKTNDAAYLIAATTTSAHTGDVLSSKGATDIWLIEVDSEDGTLRNQWNYGGPGIDEVTSMIKTSDDNYVLTGRTNSNSGDFYNNYGGYDGFVMKLDNFYNLTWAGNFGYMQDDVVNKVIETADNKFAIIGSADRLPYGNHELLFNLLSKSGAVLLDYGGLYGTGNTYGYDILQNSSGDYILAISTTSMFDGTVATYPQYQQIVMDGMGATKHASHSTDFNITAPINLVQTSTVGYFMLVNTPQEGKGVIYLNYNSNTVLAAIFGNIEASVKNNQLTVSWQTLSEKEVDYFEIELSKNGKDFVAAGKVNSKAINGNSDKHLQYNSTFSNTQLGWSLLPFVLAFLFIGNIHKKKIIFCLTAIAVLFSIAACNKNAGMDHSENGAFFVRIKQVDKDGSVHYSGVIKTINQ